MAAEAQPLNPVALGLTSLRSLAASRWIRRPVPLSGALELLAWWEVRRVAFNLGVGAAGVASIALMLLSLLVAQEIFGEPLVLPDPPFAALIPVVLYGVAANLCYTGGFAAEFVATRVWGSESGRFGEILYLLGMVFSVMLTLVPGIIAVGAVLIRVLIRWFEL